jgi:predicted PurR-regulated permease PerM
MSKGGKLIGDLFSATGNFLAIAVLIPIYIFFFIYYRRKFSAFIKMIAPSKNHEQINTIISKTSKVSQRYITGLLIDIAILSVLNSIGFMLLGLKHAFLLGTIAGMLNIIPYIGVTIGSILPVLLALITHDSLWIAVGAFGVCVAVQILDNNFLTPWIVGSAVAINPLATMIALIMGGMLWGLPGMMLFIPLLGMLKVIFDNIDTLKPLGFLISDDNIHAKKEASSDNNPNITESPSS